VTEQTDLTDFDALWNYDDPAATEAVFRPLLDNAPVASTYRIELLTQVARTQGLQRRFEEAHHTLDEAERLLAESKAEPRARVRYLLERGRTFNSSRQTDRAIPLFRDALVAAQAAGEDFYAVDAAHMLGIAAPPEQQTEWNQRAIAMAEQSSQPRARNWLGSLYNNLGWTLHDQGHHAEALEVFEKALALRRARGQTKEGRIAQWCVARALRSLGRVDEALAVQRDLQAQHEAAGTSDGYVLEEIAENLALLGQDDEARPFFAGAYAQLSQDPWLVENEAARLARLKQNGSG
jgi:tetratricopeptide (TPR) repeat protein